MTASLPTFTSLMDQALAAVEELDQAITAIDEQLGLERLKIDMLRASRRELVEQRKPIAAIIPGNKPAKAKASTPAASADPAKGPGTCTVCGAETKSLGHHRRFCPGPPATSPAPVAAHGEAPPVAQRPALQDLDRDLRDLFAKHHRESFTRRCEIAADALGKTTSQVRGIAQRLGLS